MINGTWQQTGGGGIGPPKELVWLAVIIAVMVGTAGAVQVALAAVMTWLLIIMAVFIAAAVAGAVYVVYRHRTGRPLLRMQPLVQVRELDLPQRQSWILGAPKPQALPQVTNNYFIGGHHVHGDADGMPVVRGELISRDDTDL